ncbi:hypothetical protein [Kitasatospora fiedleri]|uniref:hypothetical protein n=1 Tax=Kitasatospora fiedleri TaxID=2991545 RepID=UPI00249C8185|nr:hypothetical protein [Kitasatospora fiedleri]
MRGSRPSSLVAVARVLSPKDALALSGPDGALLFAVRAATVVELREADDAAAGELREAGVDPAVPTAAEERAYLLLGRLHGA